MTYFSRLFALTLLLNIFASAAQSHEQVSSESDIQAPTEVTYGEVYFEESKNRTAPNFFISTGYAYNFSNSFLSEHSLVADAQYRIWRYLSTGIRGQWFFSQLSSAGSKLKSLESLNISVQIPTPRWAIFSHTQLQVFSGAWNLFNWIPLEISLAVGGGAGILNRKDDFHGTDSNQFSYLWSVEQRFKLFQNLGMSAGVFGTRAASFIDAGISYSLY